MGTPPTFVGEHEDVWNSTTTPRSMTAFTPGNGNLLVAMMGEETTNGTANQLTISGGVTWTRQRNVAGINAGDCTIAAFSATGGGSSITPSLTNSGTSGKQFGANVLEFDGTTTGGIGAIASTTISGSHGTSGIHPTLNITTTQDNSSIVVIYADFAGLTGSISNDSVNGSGPTQDTLAQTGNYDVYVVHYIDAGPAGFKTVGMTMPGSSANTTMIAVEVLGTGGASTPNNKRTIDQRNRRLGKRWIRLQPLAIPISGPATVTAAFTMAGSGSLSITPVDTIPSTFTMAGSGALNITPVDTVPSSIVLTGSSTLSITPVDIIPGSIALVGSGSLVLIGVDTIPSSVAMVGSGGLSIVAVDTIPASVSMSGLGVLSIVGKDTTFANVIMVGSGSLSVVGVDIIPSTMVMSGQGALVIAISGQQTASVTMLGQGSLSITGFDTVRATVTMLGSGALVVTIVVQHGVSITMLGSGALLISPLVTRVIFVTMTGQGDLVVNAITALTAFVLMSGQGILKLIFNFATTHNFTATLGSDPWSALLSRQPDRWQGSLTIDPWSISLGEQPGRWQGSLGEGGWTASLGSEHG